MVNDAASYSWAVGSRPENVYSRKKVVPSTVSRDRIARVGETVESRNGFSFACKTGESVEGLCGADGLKLDNLIRVGLCVGWVKLPTEGPGVTCVARAGVLVGYPLGCKSGPTVGISIADGELVDKD